MKISCCRSDTEGDTSNSRKFLKKLLRRNAVLGGLEDLCRCLSLGSNAVALVLEGAVVHKDQAVPRKSEGLPDRTAAAVQPLKEEKARLFAVVEGCCRARC